MFTRTAGVICLIALIAYLACTGCAKKPVAAQNAAPPVNLAAGNQPAASVSPAEPTADNGEQPVAVADAGGNTPRPPAQNPSADAADPPPAKTEASSLNLVTGTTNANKKTPRPSSRVASSDAAAASSAKPASADLGLVIDESDTGFNLLNIGSQPIENVNVTSFPPPLSNNILLWAYRYRVGLKAIGSMKYAELSRSDFRNERGASLSASKRKVGAILVNGTVAGQQRGAMFTPDKTGWSPAPADTKWSAVKEPLLGPIDEP